jgi:hypothetical protein
LDTTIVNLSPIEAKWSDLIASDNPVNSQSRCPIHLEIQSNAMIKNNLKALRSILMVRLSWIHQKRPWQLLKSIISICRQQFVLMLKVGCKLSLFCKLINKKITKKDRLISFFAYITVPRIPLRSKKKKKWIKKSQ